MWNCRVGLALVIILTAAMAWSQAPLPTPPSDAEIRQILADRVDKQRQSVGIVVGVLEPAGRPACIRLCVEDVAFVTFQVGNVTR